MLNYIYRYQELTGEFKLVTIEFLISGIHIFTSNNVLIVIRNYISTSKKYKADMCI